jgi:type I restriction-modification system DNA methylase subunit
MARTRSTAADTAANLGFEAKLWLAADKLRNNMDAAEYKHVVLGLIFLKYISDTFEEHRAKLVAGKGAYADANPEDQDEYKAENVFWVPKEARWPHLQANAKQPAIGKLVDDAMVAIERDNPRLKGVLPKDYARPGLDKHRLGELIDLIGTIALVSPSPQPSPSGSGRSGAEGEGKQGCDRRKQTLLIDARKLGTLIDRVHRELTDADRARIVTTYHAWRGDKGAGKYQDTAGFCKSATAAESAGHGHVLTPGRYVGAEEVEDDGDPFEEEMPRLVAELHAQFAESAKLEKQIQANLQSLNLKPMS